MNVLEKSVKKLREPIRFSLRLSKTKMSLKLDIFNYVGLKRTCAVPSTKERSSSLPLTGGVCGILQFDDTKSGALIHSTSFGSVWV